MKIKKILFENTRQFFKEQHTIELPTIDFILNRTKEEFTGNYTIVLFSLSKKYQLPIDILGEALGKYLKEKASDLIAEFSIVKGFLNLTVTDYFYHHFLESTYDKKDYKRPANGEKIIVEYSSPNTNKPLHLGHLRNNFLGYSIAQIYTYNGYDVIPTCVVNDRGIHICKSMLAWIKWGNKKNPTTERQKGDHFVGNYYVRFADALKQEINEKNIPEKETELMKEAQELLVKWEEGVPETKAVWEQMNAWVYEGFKKTYQKIGTLFTKTYYESETYLLGKQLVLQGLKDGIFHKRENGSIWITLSENDEKLLLRADGTSVYITQDLGLAVKKYEDFPYEKSIYVVGDEQNYHFKTLHSILQKLPIAPIIGNIYHLSYGMVELTTGKMKSREGTVVDADDLIREMETTAQKHTENLGKIKDFTTRERTELYHIIGMAALKFFILKVDPKKRIVFNPKESIDFHGHTGPFIQYTFARIHSILSKTDIPLHTTPIAELPLEKSEKKILIELNFFEDTLSDALRENNPAIIANYTYAIAKNFNTLYAEHSFLNAENEEKSYLRLKIAHLTQHVLQACANILGITLPLKM